MSGRLEEAPAASILADSGRASPDFDSEAWRGPFAVVSEVPSGPAYAVPDAEAERPRRRLDRYVEDIPIVLAAAGLVALTFLPWYEAGGVSITAWASGTWGPIIAFLAGVSIVLVILRRLGVAVSLPVEESLFHEGVGWLALIGSVLKSRFRPGAAGVADTKYLVAYASMGLGVVLALLAGRMSPHASLVLHPGWHRGKAGKAGILLVGVAIAGAAFFGFTNSKDVSNTGLSPDDLAKRYPGYVQGLPECAKGIPIPSGLTPASGINLPEACQATFSTDKPVAEVLNGLRAALRDKKWTFTEVSQTGVTLLNITSPKCGAAAVIAAPQGGTAVTIAITPCPSPTPSPTST